MLERYFSAIDLTLEKIARGFNNSSDYAELEAPMDLVRHVVKTVHFIVCFSDLANGKAARVLAQSSFSPSVLPSVRKVYIRFDMTTSPRTRVPSTNDTTNGPSFYQQLLELFPKTCILHVQSTNSDEFESITSGCKFEQYMAKLQLEYSDITTS
ncbi:hypothetical protein GGI20_004156, partial [Coemansia sp. BCRC 34301]